MSLSGLPIWVWLVMLAFVGLIAAPSLVDWRNERERQKTRRRRRNPPKLKP